MIKQILNLFDHKYKKEPKALQALNNNNKETIKTDSSLNQKMETHVHNISLISPSNIHQIDTQKITEFSTKTLQIINELQTRQCMSWKLKIVSTDFYSKDLQFRANILCAPSITHLCKSLLMKNSKCIHNNCNDPLNSKYYLVVFQYNLKLKQQKLQKFVKKLGKKSNKYYKFSLAPAEETYKLTNFKYNCVSPVGIGNIPIIVSHHIINGNYKSIWIGSGSLNIKLCIDTKEFSDKFNPFVADITA